MKHLALLLLLVLGGTALGQVPPKAGRIWYEENVQHGFRFKAPKDWQFFPAEFGQENVLGRYVPERQAIIELGGGERFEPKLWILVFDQDYKPRSGSRGRYSKDVTAWLKDNPAEVGTNYELVDEDVLKLKGDLRAHERLFRGKGRAAKQLHMWSMTFDVSERKRIALICHAPADKRDWGKWKSQVKKIGKTFALVELETVDTGAVEGSGIRADKHKQLLENVASNPGWELYVTENYFVITNSDDKEFVKDVQKRLEAIHERFESEFPREKALRAHEVRRSGAHENRRPGRTAAAEGDPLERARCSVVRVCDSREDYVKYGGPQGSAGYWWSVSEELVIYDDKAVGGRRSTWATLHHEAFHQFIFYFFGNLAPGYWFNEGNADFYAGHKLTNRGRYQVGRFDWRNSVIKEEIREKKNVPLDVLVDMKRAGYYAQGPVLNPRTKKSETFSRYPHGWSFTYFLRTGEKNRAKNWKDEYEGILGTYLDTLIETRDTEQANAAAFAGIDWVELEKCWQQYILKGK